MSYIFLQTVLYSCTYTHKTAQHRCHLHRLCPRVSAQEKNTDRSDQRTARSAAEEVFLSTLLLAPPPPDSCLSVQLKLFASWKSTTAFGRILLLTPIIFPFPIPGLLCLCHVPQFLPLPLSCLPFASNCRQDCEALKDESTLHYCQASAKAGHCRRQSHSFITR